MTPTVRRILLSQSLERKIQNIVKNNSIAMYVPTPGVTCFQDSACTVPAAVDDPVGGLKDYLGLYPATQATSGYRPRLRGKVKNWVKYSQDVTNSIWAKNSVSVSATPYATPLGLLACSVIENTALSDHYLSVPLDGTVNTLVNIRFLVKPNGRDYIRCNIVDVVSNAIFINLVNKDYASYFSTGRSILNIEIKDSTEGFIELIIAVSLTSPLVNIYVSLATSLASGSEIYTGDGVSGVLLTGFHVGDSNIYESYIPTTSTPASSSYGPYWLDFDGVDDRLDVDFTDLAGKYYIIVAGINTLSNDGTNIPIIAGINSAANENLHIQWTVVNNFRFAQYANDLDVNQTLVPRGANNVISAILGASGKIIRNNGVVVGSDLINTKLITNIGTQIGRKNSENSYFKGCFYGIVKAANALQETDIKKIEKYLGKLAGITI